MRMRIADVDRADWSSRAAARASLAPTGGWVSNFLPFCLLKVHVRGILVTTYLLLLCLFGSRCHVLR